MKQRSTLSFKNQIIYCGIDVHKSLAIALENGMLEPIYIPSREQLGLRNLVRRENQVVKDIARAKNRIKSYLYFNGIKFLSWSGRSLKILENNAKANEDFALLSLLRELFPQNRLDFKQTIFKVFPPPGTDLY